MLLPQPLSYSRSHFWRVRAKSTDGVGPQSDKIRFDYTDSVPAPVEALAPEGEISTPTPDFEWRPASNATEYQLVVYDRSTKTRIHKVTYDAADVCDDVICRVSDPAIVLGYSRNHYFRVRPKNSGGWGEYNAKTYFDYVEEVPGVPAVVAPTGDIVELAPRLTWSPVAFGNIYRIVVKDRTTSEVVFDEQLAAATVCTHDQCQVRMPYDLRVDTPYQWKVKAQSSGGWSAYSPRSRFTVRGVQ